MDVVGALRTFVSVVEAGSLTAGARGLGLSVAAVSRQLAALEEEVGEVLLERSTRSMALTRAGERVLEQAAVILGEVARTREIARGEGRAGGSLRLAAPAALLAAWLAPALPIWASQRPGLVIDLRSEDGIGWARGEVRVVISEGPVVLPGARCEEVGALPRVWVASGAYLSARGAPGSWEELAAHGVVSAAAGAGDGGWGAQGVGRGQGGLRSAEPQAALAWAVAGLGIACVPRCVAAAALRAGQVEALALEAPPLRLQALVAAEEAGVEPTAAALAWLRRLV